MGLGRGKLSAVSRQLSVKQIDAEGRQSIAAGKQQVLRFAQDDNFLFYPKAFKT
jgi:hypothetical protein